jgi:hypothetical protein
MRGDGEERQRRGMGSDREEQLDSFGAAQQSKLDA